MKRSLMFAILILAVIWFSLLPVLRFCTAHDLLDDSTAENISYYLNLPG